MGSKYKPVVDHVTRIILSLVEQPLPYDMISTEQPPTADNVRAFGDSLAQRTERVAAMMDALADKGFSFKARQGYIYADSTELGAWDAKNYLLEKGFHEHEFQIYLEYARKWGMM